MSLSQFGLQHWSVAGAGPSHAAEPLQKLAAGQSADETDSFGQAQPD